MTTTRIEIEGGHMIPLHAADVLDRMLNNDYTPDAPDADSAVVPLLIHLGLARVTLRGECVLTEYGERVAAELV